MNHVLKCINNLFQTTSNTEVLSSIELNEANELGHTIGSEYNVLRIRLKTTTNPVEKQMLTPRVEELKAQRDQVLDKIDELETVSCR